MKILVVDDDDLVRTVTVEALEEAGFEVIEATTGEEAIERCRERIADILFTDIRLPGRIDGWDIAEHCREADPSLPVIYATGYSMKESRLVPGSHLFQKPFKVELLVEVIRGLAKDRAALN